MKKALLLLSAAAALIGFTSLPAVAQDYPTRPITLVVAYPPGGGADAIGRLVGEKLQEGLGKAVVIDNRPGFSGNIGAQYVAKSNPDGYTLLVAPWTTYAINGVLYGTQRVGYALDKDFVGVSTLGFQPMALMINPSVPANNVAELIAYAKSKPGALSFGSTGPGSLEHIAGEMFKRSAGISMVHVPYKGSGPAMTDLIGGQIQVYFATAPTVVQHMNTGRVKTLMVTTPERNPALANLPTPREAGVQNFEVRSTYGLLAPAGTPPAVIKKLNDEIVKILGNPEVKAKFRSLGVDAVASTPDELTQRIPQDIARWSAIMKQADIKAE
ncbi:MAG TPA: tripartite tricarboxylate transporter substrate binding protein [Ramlibacter sp.]|nr:tripartite tricarboxylate transporter substrate binding protein [Ramlibacter sp.]